MTNDIRNLIKTGFAHIFGSTVINKVIAMMSGVILVRILSKEAYAQYTYAENIFGYFIILSGFGMTSATMQVCSEYIGNKKDQSRFFNYGYKFGLRFNIILAILIFFVSLIIPLPVGGSAIILRLMCCFPIFLFICDMQKIHLRISLENKKYSFLNTIDSSLILLLSVIGALLWQTYGLVVFKYITYLCCIIIAIVFFRIPITSFKSSNTTISPHEKRDILWIASITTLNNGLGQILTLAEITLIGYFVLDSTAIATYRAASMIPAALSFIPLAFMTYSYPYFAQHLHNKNWVKNKFFKAMGGLSIVNFIISIGGVIFAPIIIKILFGSGYIEAVTTFRILMIAYFFAGSFRVLAGNILATQRKLKYNLIMGVSSGIFHIILLIILINKYGAIGAAYSHLITMILSGACNVIYLLYCLKEKSKFTNLE